MGSKQTDSEDTITIPKKYAIITLMLVLALLGYIVYRQIELHELIQLGQFYKTHVKGYELDSNWQMNAEELRREKKIIDRLLIQQGNHRITREQLGRQSWGFLHMVSTTAPDEISPQLRQQINAFIHLFGKMYPCKLCANYFMRTLKKIGPFKGQTKMDLMDYMCQLHNKVNKRLKKPQYDCDMVPAEWGTCDCFSKNPINNIK